MESYADVENQTKTDSDVKIRTETDQGEVTETDEGEVSGVIYDFTGEKYVYDEEADEEDNPDEEFYDIPEDEEPLINSSVGEVQKESWWGFTKRISGKVSQGVLATAMAIPTAVYALFTLAKSGPSDFVLAWDSLGTGTIGYIKKALSIAFGLASLRVNASLNFDFFSQLPERIKTTVIGARKSLKKLLIASLSIVLGIGGGISAAALAYGGMESSFFAAIIFAGFNFGIYSIGRFLGVNKVLTRVLSPDIMRVQNELMDKLQHVNAKYRKNLQRIIDNGAKHLLEQHRNKGEPARLNKEDFDEIMVELARGLSNLADLHPAKLFNQKTTSEYTKEYAGILFDITFATVVASWAFITFGQKGYNGVELGFDLFGKDISDMDDLYKILIGTTGGLASAALYGISAFDVRKLTAYACEKLYKNPRQIPNFLRELVEQTLASTSMYTVGSSIPGPKNIFSIPKAALAVYGSGATGAVGCLGINIAPALKKLVKEPNNQRPKLKEMEEYYIPTINAIDESNTKRIRQEITLFKPKRREALENGEQKKLDPSNLSVSVV